MNHEGRAQEGTIELTGGQGYALFGLAEQRNLSVTKMLTGRDLPLLNIEWQLLQTFALVKEKLQKKRSKKK